MKKSNQKTIALDLIVFNLYFCSKNKKARFYYMGERRDEQISIVQAYSQIVGRSSSRHFKKDS